MFRMILVPLDGSPASEASIPIATSLARRSGAELELMRVHRPLLPIGEIPFPANPDEDLDIERGEEAYLRERAERVRTQTGVPARWHLVTSEQAAGSIEDRAEAIGADLVVMTTHGRGGVARMWLGSVADRVIRHIAIPTLLVKADSAPANVDADAAIQHILIPLDGSAASEQILEPAMRLGGTTARYTLLTVELLEAELVPPNLELLAAPGATGFAEQIAVDLERVRGRLHARGIQADTRTVKHHSPAGAILDVAEEAGVDVIALSTHGHGGAARFLLGSVSDKVIRGASVPVLVQRTADHP